METLDIRPRFQGTTAHKMYLAERSRLNRTARTLRLDYYVLKKRVQQVGALLADPPENGAATFLELAPSLSAGACECTLDLENASGAKVRVHLKGSAPDLVALSQSFWDHQP
jgi:hypothetical protein